ncbi:MAG TPA: cache domain-containing protein [Geobacteraceae bacterium]|nr:cache domain-containing protein [Geobacteraceae bacterium]
MKKLISIRNAMIASIAVQTLVPMLIVMTVSVAMFHRETGERIRLDNLKVAHTVSSAVELFLARPLVMLKQIRDQVNDHVGTEFQNLKSVANSTLDTDPLFESILFLDTDGNLLGTAGSDEQPVKSRGLTQNYSGNELFKRVKSSGRPAWSEPYVSLRTGESVISLGIPWKDGVISGAMNLSYLSKLVEPTKTSKKAYAFIVSPAGRLIAHPDRSLIGEKEAFISIPQITAGFQGQSGTYSFTLSGRKVIGSVLPFSQNDWVIVSVHDKENAYAHLYEIERLLAFLTLVVLAGALFFAFRRINRLSAPIFALTDLSKSLAAGEEVRETSVFSGYIEINDLYENFIKMAEAVHARERDLQDRNEELASAEEELRSQVEEYLRTYNELEAEKVKLESILASMGEGLSILDRDYKVVLQNQAHKNLIGESVGRYCYEAFNHNATLCDDCPMKFAFEDGGTHQTLRRVTYGSEDLFLEISASPLRNASGEVVGGIEVVRDVTDRIKADNEIRRLNQDLEKRVIERTAELEIANRELESFSYSVSHDLRAPLRHISSYSSIMESEYSDRLDEEVKNYLSRIVAGCNKMGLLIDDLLELSQLSMSELKFGPVNLSRIANSIAASLIEREPERKVRFKIEEGLESYGDERLLEVMLNNLFGNAWKYSSKVEDAVIEFGHTVVASRPVYFVKDNGAGFDNNYADNLFAPFHRLHGPEFEGTGIGLAIVQRIIHRHGGKVWADAVEGEGATFYFTLKG